MRTNAPEPMRQRGKGPIRRARASVRESTSHGLNKPERRALTNSCCSSRDKKRPALLRGNAGLQNYRAGYLGSFTILIYGLGAFQPSGNFFFASSSETDGTMITSSPRFQLAGVATANLLVSCNESITRRSSSKLRPVVMGYWIMSLIFL